MCGILWCQAFHDGVVADHICQGLLLHLLKDLQSPGQSLALNAGIQQAVVDLKRQCLWVRFAGVHRSGGHNNSGKWSKPTASYDFIVTLINIHPDARSSCGGLHRLILPVRVFSAKMACLRESWIHSSLKLVGESIQIMFLGDNAALQYSARP